MSSDQPSISRQELQLAARNHGTPLEALRHAVTPAGLHYLLTHYDMPLVDADVFRLVLDGRVRRTLSLTLDELRSLPQVTTAVTMECAGNGRATLEPHVISQPWLLEAVGTGEWTGTPLWALLERAGLEDDVVELVFEGLDAGVEGGRRQAYARSLTVEQATAPEVLLAHQLNGAPLPQQHGFPLRLVVPGWYGMTNVKWLGRITAVTEPFAGYQQAHSYRMRQHEDEVGTPITRIEPRALMVPPGVPEFITRERTVEGSPVELRGRAWSGWAEIETVEVSDDGGASWRPARLDDPAGAHAWRGWSYTWQPPRPGAYELCCRAADVAGNRQPDRPRWNVGGYCNNAVQRISVTVV